MNPRTFIPRFVALLLGVTLCLPNPAWALRQTGPEESGEISRLQRALQSDAGLEEGRAPGLPLDPDLRDLAERHGIGSPSHLGRWFRALLEAPSISSRDTAVEILDELLEIFQENTVRETMTVGEGSAVREIPAEWYRFSMLGEDPKLPGLIDAFLQIGDVAALRSILEEAVLPTGDSILAQLKDMHYRRPWYAAIDRTLGGITPPQHRNLYASLLGKVLEAGEPYDVEKAVELLQGSAGLEERMQGWVDKWGLAGLDRPRVAAITPEVLRQEPRLQALLGKPLFLGQAAIVVVPSEPDSIGNTAAALLERFSGKQRPIVQPYGYRGDEALEIFERAVRTPAAGFTVLERIPVADLRFSELFRQLIANLTGLHPERVDPEEVAQFLADIMA